MALDEELAQIGDHNKRRMLIYFLISTSARISSTIHMMAIVFLGVEVDHWCRLEVDELKNESIPLVYRAYKGKEQWRPANCKRYANKSLHDSYREYNSSVLSCNNVYQYNTSVFTSTIVTEWDLVCEKDYYMEMSQTIYNSGIVIGSLVFSVLADKFGRKPVHLASQYLMIIVGVAVAVSPNYVIFVALRFLLGSLRPGCNLVGVVMACELFSASRRTQPLAGIDLFGVVGWMLLTLFAYLIRDWRCLQLVISLSAAWTVILIWILPESVPWLVANDRMDEAKKVLRDFELSKNSLSLWPVKEPISDRDRIDANGQLSDENKPETIVKKCIWKFDRLKNPFIPVKKDSEVSSDATSSQVSFLDIFRSRKMSLYFLIMFSLWFSMGIVYYGLSLSTSNMGGNIFVNFIVNGLAESPACIVIIFVLDRFGRRRPLFAFQMLAIIVLTANIFIPAETANGINLEPLIVTFATIAKFAMTAAFATIVLYSLELFPTNIRNFACGVVAVASRIAGMIAPFLAYLGKTNFVIPGVIFVTCLLTTTLLGLFLPETHGRPLPDTIEEVETWTRKKPSGNLEPQQAISQILVMENGLLEEKPEIEKVVKEERKQKKSRDERMSYLDF